MGELGTDITAQTGLLALLGHPVRHSLSPRIHNAALQAQGVNMVYLAFDVPPSLLSPAVEGLRTLGVRGANITIPHKEHVVGLLDRLDPLADQVGAVNTIVNDDGVLSGHNTDVEGFQSALRSLLPEGAEGRRCLVAGAGGAARAVLAALVAERVQTIWVLNRTLSRAEALCSTAIEWGADYCAPITEDHLDQVGPSADVIVNATSVGLDPAGKGSPFPADILNSNQAVIDLVYGSAPTALMRQAQARGALTIDGTEMLLIQAANAYRLWTGIDAPLDIMRAVIRRPGT
ncbi:MAG: shikimate dehydrogenase [Thermoleophilia bacterium]|jgi:shikimate dehydrogenase